MLEVLPAVVGFAVLVATRRRFPLTSLAYLLILAHCIVLMVGGHYTYAEVPLFDWIRDGFGLERNNYDKVGHFVQGFVPAIVAREIHTRPNRTRHSMNNALIALGVRNAKLEKKARTAAKKIGRVDVDHGETSCRTPDADSYMTKTLAHQKKRKRC